MDIQRMDSHLKLWIYTNYDCNLTCSYCLSRSGPTTPRNAISYPDVCRLIDQALDLNFDSVFFTGGEPFLLDEIYGMLEYSSRFISTVVLTNGLLLNGKRLEKLKTINNPNLIIQVSLDGACADHHDPYRGEGNWEKTDVIIHDLIRNSFHVRLSTTITPINSSFIDQLCAYHLEMGINEEDHVIRQLAKRGFSAEGMEVGYGCLSPEITVNRDGVFWHPLSTDKDMLVTREIFPLSKALNTVNDKLLELNSNQESSLKTVH